MELKNLPLFVTAATNHWRSLASTPPISGLSAISSVSSPLPAERLRTVALFFQQSPQP